MNTEEATREIVKRLIEIADELKNAQYKTDEGHVESCRLRMEIYKIVLSFRGFMPKD